MGIDYGRSGQRGRRSLGTMERGPEAKLLVLVLILSITGHVKLVQVALKKLKLTKFVYK